jgi:hypothetical protein
VLIGIRPSALRETRWYQYGLRFLLGGAITALVGIITKLAGPAFGGLFLAFPAILPASATLIESHIKEEKKKNGLEGTERARKVAGVDAIGAAMGSIGLLAFAFWAWRFLPKQSAPLALATATLIWFGVSILIWNARKYLRVSGFGTDGASHEEQLHDI